MVFRYSEGHVIGDESEWTYHAILCPRSVPKKYTSGMTA